MITLLRRPQQLGLRLRQETMSGERTLLSNLEAADRRAAVALLEDRLEDLVDTGLLDTGLQVVEVAGRPLLLPVLMMGMAVDHHFHLLPLLLEEDSLTPFWQP